jgi:uncharacterized protein
MKKISVLLFIAACFLSLTAIENDRNFPSVTVTGHTFITKKADTAMIHFSILKESSKLEYAVEHAKRELDIIIENLKETDVKKEDVSTAQFKTKDGYKYLFGSKKYKVTIEAAIKVKNLEKLEKVIFILADNKIKGISAIDFNLSDEGEVFQQVQLDAVRAAKKKAELIADELGIKINGIYSVTQLSSKKFDAAFSMRGSSKFKPSPFNPPYYQSTSQETPTKAVFSGDIRIEAEYEVIFRAVNPQETN